MKKFVSILMLFCLLFSMAVPAMASEASPSSQDYPSDLPELGEEKPNTFADALNARIFLHVQQTNGHAIANAVFEIYQGSVLKETLTTDASGSVLSQYLEPGDYTVKEKTIPNGYAPKNKSVSVTLGDNMQRDMLFEYELEAFKQSIQVKKTDDNGNVLAGAVFAVHKADDSKVEEITTGADGMAESTKLLEGSYYLKEIKGVSGYTMDTSPKNFIISSNQTSVQTITVINTLIPVVKGSVSLLKKDDRGNAVPGAVFGIFNASGNQVAELTSDAQGKASKDALELGDYSMKEIQAPEGYIMDSQIQRFSVSDVNTSHNFTFTNTRITGKVRVLKTGANQAPLQGVVFSIYQAQSNVAIAELTTGADGTAISASLDYGKYYLKEKTAADGYELNPDPIAFTISEHKKTVELKTSNTLITGSIKIIKVDATSAERLKGAVFILSSGQGQKVAELTTDDKGEASYSSLPKGDYSLKEKTAPEGYVLSDTVTGFSIQSNGEVVEKSIANTKGYATLELVKVGENGAKLEGVQFDIFNQKNNEKVSSITTDSSGKTTVVLPLGKYSLKETKTLDDYILLEKAVEFELKEQGGKLSLSVENKKKPVDYGTLKVTKTDASDANKKLQGAVFGIFKNDNNEKVAEITTGTDGIATSEKLPVGKYYLVEQTAPQAYLRSDAKHAITVEKDKVSEITITNESITAGKGVLSLTKTDKDNKLLQGAVFAVSDMNGTKVTELTTSAEGLASCELPAGKYTLQETTAPKDYKLDDSKRDVTITQGKTESLTILNEKDIENLQIVKSAAGSGEKLAGAVFGVYKEGSTTKIAELTTDANGLASMKLEQGSYFLLELKAPTGFVPEKTKIPFTVNNASDVVKVEVTNVRANDLATQSKTDTGSPGTTLSIPKTGQAVPTLAYVASALCFSVMGLCAIGVYILRRKHNSI